MAFPLSPGVNFSEIDLTTIVPGSSASVGAYAGDFTWGPINEPGLISNELVLVDLHGKPDDNTATSFLTVANFNGYGGASWVTRTANTAAVRNAQAGALANVIVLNGDDYNNQSGALNTTWVARYPGAKGNGLKVSVCPTATAFSGTLANTADTIAASANVKFTGANVVAYVTVGDYIKVGAEAYIQVTAASFQGGNTYVTLATAVTANATAATVLRKWEYADKFLAAPGTSDFATSTGATNDEIHVIVVDAKGKFSGTPGTTLEKYQFLSKASNAKYPDGTTQYYKLNINQRSQFIWFGGNHVSGANNAWGTAADTSVNFEPTPIAKPETATLTLGVDAMSTDANRITGYDYFNNPDTYDISLVISGEASTTLDAYLVANIAEYRLDCVAFLSPLKNDVVYQRGNELTNVTTTRDVLSASSYAFMDCNWKYQYDKYNDVNRWVPLNGDIAGLAVRTDQQRDAWFSIAGLNRGRIKNVVKLAWNPNKAQRDELYKKGINPVVSFPQEGPVLFGDKTMQTKPSAFTQLGVRRLFILLEKSISKAAKYSLFEFNNQFTRAQFVAMVDPFLRTVQGRQGIEEYKVVCDETNNDGDVRSAQQFIGDIYVIPANSINYIQLNFVAVRSGVSFSTIVGKF